MHIFRFNAPYCSEDDFRWNHSDEIHTKKSNCFNSLISGCPNECNYLISGDIEASGNGLPSVFGLDCDVEASSWDGDIDDVTTETFCRECAKKAP